MINKKAQNFYRYFIIVSFVIWFILATHNIWGSWVSHSNLPIISQSLSSFAAILNLVFVITIFNLNQRDKEKEVTLARQSYWFRNIILDKNIDLVHECFDSLLKNINNVNQDHLDDEEFLKSIELYQDKKRLLIRLISDMIRISDDNFADKLDGILDDHEDLFTEATQDLFTCSANDWYQKKTELEKSILYLKRSFLKEIYLYEKNGYAS